MTERASDSNSPIKGDVLGIASLGDAVKILAQGTVEGAGALLGRLLLPAADETGLLLRDMVSQRRAARLRRGFSVAAERLRSTGEEARAVPERTLAPLLDGMANEDDPDLSELWTSLLTRAASPSSPPVPPIFPALLRQLTPRDAAVLQAFLGTEKRRSPHWASASLSPSFGWPIIRPNLGKLGTEMEIRDSVTTLVGLGLLVEKPEEKTSTGRFIRKMSVGSSFALTELGARLLEAVAPSRTAASDQPSV